MSCQLLKREQSFANKFFDYLNTSSTKEYKEKVILSPRMSQTNACNLKSVYSYYKDEFYV